MKLFTEQKIKEYIAEHPESRVALQDWVVKVKRATWNGWSVAEGIKQCFGTEADCVGKNQYQFSIRSKGVNLKIVAKYISGFLYITNL